MRIKWAVLNIVSSVSLYQLIFFVKLMCFNYVKCKF